MKLGNIALCLLLTAGAAVSCIREDMSDCVFYSNNKLILSYKGDGATEMFGDKICRVEMYVFDADNECVGRRELSEEELSSRSAALPQLADGRYRIVCLGNTHNTTVDGIDSRDFSGMTFADDDYCAGAACSGNDSLYYASLPVEVTQEDRTHTALFASSHYDLLVEVAGVPEAASAESGTRAAAVPTLELHGAMPRTDFENRACGEPECYYLETEYDGGDGILTARTNIMRHEDHSAVDLLVVPSGGGEPLAAVNLAEFLAANPEIDTSKHEVLIPIRIEFKSGDVVISLPEWYVENVKPEF